MMIHGGEFDPRLMTGIFVAASIVVICCFVMVFFSDRKGD